MCCQQVRDDADQRLHCYQSLDDHELVYWRLMMTPLLISTGTGSLPVRTSLCCEMSSLWKAMPSHIRSMSCTLFQITVSMNFCGGRRVGFRRVHTMLAPLSRPCLVLSVVLSALYLKVYHWQGRDNAQVCRQLSFITAHI